jgi:hypothetical protein
MALTCGLASAEVGVAVASTTFAPPCGGTGWLRARSSASTRSAQGWARHQSRQRDRSATRLSPGQPPGHPVPARFQRQGSPRRFAATSEASPHAGGELPIFGRWRAVGACLAGALLFTRASAHRPPRPTRSQTSAETSAHPHRGASDNDRWTWPSCSDIIPPFVIRLAGGPHSRAWRVSRFGDRLHLRTAQRQSSPLTATRRHLLRPPKPRISPPRTMSARPCFKDSATSSCSPARPWVSGSRCDRSR